MYQVTINIRPVDGQLWAADAVMGHELLASVSAYVNRVDALCAVMAILEQRIARDGEKVFPK